MLYYSDHQIHLSILGRLVKLIAYYTPSVPRISAQAHLGAISQSVQGSQAQVRYASCHDQKLVTVSVTTRRAETTSVISRT